MNEKLRADFPVLKHVIYMDSAATSLTPDPVVEAVAGYYRYYNANVGRSVYRLAQQASQKYKEAHRKVADFIGAKSEDAVVFTKNTTEAINMVAYGLEWQKGDEVVTTLLEHHSNFLPWFEVQREGVKLRIVKPDRTGKLELADFEAAINDSTKLVAVTHVSNVLGTISQIKELATICKERGVLLLVDAAQSVPHIQIDAEELGCDFIAFSGHKMLGPTGTGVLWMKDPDKLVPAFVGGGMIEAVSVDDYELAAGYERFEAGTPNIAGGIGLGRAVDYLTDVGMVELKRYEERLTNKLMQGLRAMEDMVEVYGTTNPDERIGVVSFNINGMDPHEVALRLDRDSNIAVRSGHHCCMPLMHYLGLKQGTVRVSVYLYNTEEEVDKFLESVERIAE